MMETMSRVTYILYIFALDSDVQTDYCRYIIKQPSSHPRHTKHLFLVTSFYWFIPCSSKDEQLLFTDTVVWDRKDSCHSIDLAICLPPKIIFRKARSLCLKSCVRT